MPAVTQRPKKASKPTPGAVLRRALSKGVSDVAVGSIDPLALYGFKDALKSAIETGEPFVMPDHPDFPNPRTSFSDKSGEVMDAVREAGEVTEPIRVLTYKNSGGQYEYVVVDGRTRLTAVGRYMQENPEDAKAFRLVPYLPFDGSADEALAYMVSTNYDRENLDDLAVGKFLLTLDAHKVSEKEQARMLHKDHKGGVRWIRATKKVAESKVLSDALASGAIDAVTARQIAGDVESEDKRAQVVAKVQAKLAEQRAKTAQKLKEKTARSSKKASSKPKPKPKADVRRAAKAAGASRTNITTIGWREVQAKLTRTEQTEDGSVRNWFEDLKGALKADEEGVFDNLDWGNADARGQFLEAYEHFIEFSVYMQVLRLDSLSLREQVSWVERRMSTEQIAALSEDVRQWLPKVEGEAAPAPAPKSKAPAKAASKPKVERRPKKKASDID